MKKKLIAVFTRWSKGERLEEYMINQGSYEESEFSIKKRRRCCANAIDRSN